MFRYAVTQLPGNKVRISSICPISKCSWALTLTTEEYSNLRKGVISEIAFPSLTPSEHRLLMSGILTTDPSDFSDFE